MVRDTGMGITADERIAAVYVARWLVVALPQELTNALEHYAAHLGRDATPEHAVRQILRELLLSQLDAQCKLEWGEAFLDGSFVPAKKG
jgi:hypothetical protein